MAVIDIRNHGAIEGSDCTAAIEAACAAVRDGDELYVPTGRWKQRKTTQIGLARIVGRTGVTVNLAGYLELNPQAYTGDVIQLLVKDCVRTRVIGEGGLLGNFRAILAGGYAVNEQTHGLQVEASEDVEVRGIKVYEPWGDGLRLMGGNPPFADRVIAVKDFTCYDFHRSGIGIQKRVMGAEISRAKIVSREYGDQCIDFEPSESSTPGNMPWDPGDAPRDVVIDGCYLERRVKANGGYADALTLSGCNTMEPAFNCAVRNTTIIGDVSATDVWGLTMENCPVYGSPGPTPALNFKKVSSHMTFRGLRVYKQNGLALKLAFLNSGKPSDFLGDDLRIWAAQAAYFEHCDRITLSHCRAYGDGTLPAYYAKAIAEPFDSFHVLESRAEGYSIGMRCAASDQPMTVRRIGNDFSKCTVGIQDSGAVTEH